MKSATLFSGGEGAGLGMAAAGSAHAWGIEYDDRIAQVARDNGFNVLTADILQCDPADFEPVDWLHDSPPCPNFSNAKANAEETDNDRALAAKVCEFITELLPRVFTLENVYQYRKSKSWQRIARTLLTHGYAVNYWHVNMADYGVPQTRKRMIAIARRDGQTPMLPPATHDEKPQAQLFGAKRPWVSWYEAVEDLIPTLRPSKPADWQVPQLPEMDGFPFAFDGSNAGRPLTILNKNQPFLSITATGEKTPYRAYIPNKGIVGLDTEARRCFQSFPDTYQLPDSNALACRIIGNAIPPLFMQRLGEWLK